jgi:phage replication O-like protein O
MASPQIENGYTKIANELFEVLYRTEGLLKGSQGQMILAIIRKTYGFNKKEDLISISQLCEATNLSKRTIIYTLQQLEAKNIIKITRQSKEKLKETNCISFNKDYETWKLNNCSPQVKKKRELSLKRYHEGVVHKLGGSAQVCQKVVHKSAKKVQTCAHTKERKKYKRNSEDKSSPIKKNMKKNSLSNPYKENQHSDSYEDVINIDTGEIEKTKSTKKYPNAPKVYSLWGKYPKNWKINKTQLLAAENLYEERGLVQIKKALTFYQENKHLKFCPRITSPFDLDSKWTKLFNFKKDL